MAWHSLPQWKKTKGGRFIELCWTSADHWRDLKNPILIMGGVHGDEPEGVFLAQELNLWLKSHATSKSIILIPCLNPDGIAKNTRVNENGVDLNRNYPSKNWNKEAKAERYFPGQNPGSEVETQAVIEIITAVKPQLIIHCHSWKPMVVCSGPPAQTVANILGEVSGYEVVESIGYDTPGSLSEFGWMDNHIPVVCIEEREGASREETWNRFSPAFEKILL